MTHELAMTPFIFIALTLGKIVASSDSDCWADDECPSSQYCADVSLASNAPGLCIDCVNCNIRFNRREQFAVQCAKTWRGCGQCQDGFQEILNTNGEPMKLCQDIDDEVNLEYTYDMEYDNGLDRDKMKSISGAFTLGMSYIPFEIIGFAAVLFALWIKKWMATL